MGVNPRVVFFELGLGDFAECSSVPLDGQRERQRFNRTVRTCTNLVVFLSVPAVGPLTYRTVCEDIGQTYAVHTFLVFVGGVS